MSRNNESAGGTPTTPADTKRLDSIGTHSGEISVELSTRFLEHFSEQLYSSPQKAFEELISNGWDAGADYVDVRLGTNLTHPGATLTVLDNGSSMNEEGLKLLWHIASSPKKNTPILFGRPVIGKFGIGKLATYVLANKLTYICKAPDGVIRRVTMDYSTLDQVKPSKDGEAVDGDKLIRDVKLEIFEVSPEEVYEALKTVSGGTDLTMLIRDGVKRPEDPKIEDEFGGQKAKFEPPPKGTWTLVILSELKPTGKELKMGILRRMLAAALPIGSEIAIAINGDLLASSKFTTEIQKEWLIGPELSFDSFYFYEDDVTPPVGAEVKPTSIKVKAVDKPYPHVTIDGISGAITGRVKLFQEKISRGKSEDRGASNGFHVNVLGRVVNQGDPSFGEENLSHAVWASFRMTVRADGLNEYLTTNREQFKDRRQIKVFRAFLRKVFNLARSKYESDDSAILPHGGDVLVQSLGVISLSPLRNLVDETLAGKAPVVGMFDEGGIIDREAKRQSWKKDTSDNIKNALSEVKFEKTGDENDSFVKFRLSDNSIVINKDHPFVEEHSKTKAEKDLLRTVAMVNLLSDVYALEIGVGAGKLQSIREYRDKIMRFRAMQSRQSGTYIATLLLQMQHESKNFRLLEAAVSDALRYLGFQVVDKAQRGEPEGIAFAYPTPTQKDPSEDDAAPPLYRFTFDAKASKELVAQTNNINLAGIVEHRERYNADYALVIAPGYQDGAMEIRCEQQVVTPITAADLGRLLTYTVEYGAIPVTKLRELFSHYSPNAVATWVRGLEEWLTAKRPLSLDIFIKALEHLKGKIPDVLSASTVAYTCREELKKKTVKDADVVALVRGLSILVPDIIAIDNDKIVVNASAEKVAEAVRSQLEKLHKVENEAANGGVAKK